MLYTAVAGIGTFATPSVEFSMAIRIFRLLLLVLTGLFKTYGFIIGAIINLIIIVTTKSFDKEKGYLWPLIPFNSRALFNIIFRNPIRQITGKKSN